MTNLASYIEGHVDRITKDWENFALDLPPAVQMTKRILEEHLHDILLFISSDLRQAQSPSEELTKSQGRNAKDRNLPLTAAEVHGAFRHINGYEAPQLVSEFRALRASITRLWLASIKEMGREQLLDLIRFNEAIDQVIQEALSKFTENMDVSR